MDEYTISDTLPALYARNQQTAAVLNVSLECNEAYLEFVADPNDGTITIASVMSPDDNLGFDVEDFALLTTLLLRQAQRS